MDDSEKKQKVATFFNNFKQYIMATDDTNNNIALFDFLFYSTLTDSYELYYNFENLYNKDDLKGRTHKFYINHLRRAKLESYKENKISDYDLQIDASLSDLGNLKIEESSMDIPNALTDKDIISV